MEFAPKELCEKLQAMGCVSESDSKWVELIRDNRDDYVSRTYEVIHRDAWTKYIIDGNSYDDFKKSVPAFVQNDFTGATEQANENCKIVWPDSMSDMTPLWVLNKKAMLWVHTDNNMSWHQYLEQTMVKGIWNIEIKGVVNQL